MGLAQNYQDPILWWARQLVENPSTRRRVTAIVPNQIQATFVDAAAAADILPAVTNRAYLLRNMDLATLINITGLPLLTFYNPFAGVQDFQRTWNINVNAGANNCGFGPVLVSRLRYGAGMSAGTVSLNATGYIIDWTI